MISSVEFKNKTWTITHEATGHVTTADQVVGDFLFMRNGQGRGKVLIAYGVSLEQVAHLPTAVKREMGVQPPTTSVTAKRPPPGTRRLRLMPGGAVESFAV